MKSKAQKKSQDLADLHYETSMGIALQAVRIHEMQKALGDMAQKLFQIEAEIEKHEAELKGSGLN